MQLSIEQQGMVESALWVVNFALKQYNQPHNEDLKQSTILYLCKCVQGFDPSQGVKWTTFAYKNAFFYIKRSIKKEKEKVQALYSENIEDFESYIGTEDVFCEDKFTLENLYKRLTETERKVLELRKQGFRVDEICSMTNYTLTKVKRTFKSIKEKARENFMFMKKSKISKDDQELIVEMYFDKLWNYSRILEYFGGKYIYADLKTFLDWYIENAGVVRNA